MGGTAEPDLRVHLLPKFILSAAGGRSLRGPGSAVSSSTPGLPAKGSLSMFRQILPMQSGDSHSRNKASLSKNIQQTGSLSHCSGIPRSGPASSSKMLQVPPGRLVRASRTHTTAFLRWRGRGGHSWDSFMLSQHPGRPSPLSPPQSLQRGKAG